MSKEQHAFLLMCSLILRGSDRHGFEMSDWSPVGVTGLASTNYTGENKI